MGEQERCSKPPRSFCADDRGTGLRIDEEAQRNARWLRFAGRLAPRTGSRARSPRGRLPRVSDELIRFICWHATSSRPFDTVIPIPGPWQRSVSRELGLIRTSRTDIASGFRDGHGATMRGSSPSPIRRIVGRSARLVTRPGPVTRGPVTRLIHLTRRNRSEIGVQHTYQGVSATTPRLVQTCSIEGIGRNYWRSLADR
jgi:hypothetical protein